jgi:uroporphyrinogen III methyltransferase/synthase
MNANRRTYVTDQGRVERRPPVALVGAGPGDPGLLTLRAAECLAEADVILHDRSIPPRLLEQARPGARRVPVGHPSQGGPDVVRAATEAVRQGLRVVRLVRGDPSVSRRAAREARVLRAAGLEYEMVSGVSDALAAACYAGVPLLDAPGGATALAVQLREGHPDAAHCEAFVRFPGTLVFTTTAAGVQNLARSLLEHGKGPDTPVAVVRRGGTNRQGTAVSTLGRLADPTPRGRPGEPRVVLVGEAVRRRRALAWFERRPLFGRRVLVTRPRGQAGDLVGRLERLGAAASVLPAVEIREPPDWGPVDRALADLGRFRWVVFTSANGVHAFVHRLRETGRDLRALGPVRLAAIGPATAAALRGYHLEPDLVPARYRSEGLAAELRERARGGRVLLARADRGRELLREELARVAEVEQVSVYAQADTAAPDPQILRSLSEGRIHYVTLTSSNIARALTRVLDDEARDRIRRGEVRLVTISDVTSQAVRELGLPVAAEAKEETVPGVVAALVALAGGGAG